MAGERAVTATIDRVERDEAGNELAVLVFDDGQQLVVALDSLPDGARPAQVIRVLFRLDLEETARRATEVDALQRELFRD